MKIMDDGPAGAKCLYFTPICEFDGLGGLKRILFYYVNIPSA